MLAAYVPLSFQTLSRATIIYLAQAEWNNIDPDQLASRKPADLDLYCLKTGYIRL